MARTSGSVSMESMVWAEIDEVVESEDNDLNTRSDVVEHFCTTEESVEA